MVGFDNSLTLPCDKNSNISYASHSRIPYPRQQVPKCKKQEPPLGKPELQSEEEFLYAKLGMLISRMKGRTLYLVQYEKTNI